VKTGPIIRIRPDELHILDPSYYDTLYSRSAKRDKHHIQTQRLGYTSDVFSTAPHDLHRSRRNSLNPFFSRQKIEDYQPVIRGHVEKLCTVIKQYRDEGKVLAVDRMWTALTTDVISNYAFGKEMGHIVSPGFKDSFIESTVLLTQAMLAGVHFPWLMPLLDKIPANITKKLQPDLQVAIGFKDVSSTSSIYPLLNGFQFC
jgi:cytochrome P450